jgi:diguanylate cyclase (GGDEF)-like protein
VSDLLAWLLFGAVVVALAAFFIVLLVHERRAARRLEASIGDLSNQMARLVREVHAAADRSHDHDQRARILGELAGTIDLDEVLARVLEAAGAVRGVDAALVTVAGAAGEKPIVATVGLSTEEADMAVAGPPDGYATRAVTVAYEYPPELDSNGNDLIRHGVAIPIPGETRSIGHLVVFSRAHAHAFGEADKRSLEDLAGRAGPAIENAHRFREARQLADLDALTGLHNRRFFHETLAREVARAQRYGRRLALVVFDLDDFKAINDRIGHLAGDGVLAEVAERVKSVVRSADIACRVGGDEFGIILPESAIADAEQLSHRMQAAVAARPIGDAGTLQLSAGAAELHAEDDATRLFERADDALYRAKESGKAEVVAASPNDPFPANGDDRAIGPLG